MKISIKLIKSYLLIFLWLYALYELYAFVYGGGSTEIFKESHSLASRISSKVHVSELLIEIVITLLVITLPPLYFYWRTRRNSAELDASMQYLRNNDIRVPKYLTIVFLALVMFAVLTIAYYSLVIKPV